MRDNTMLKRAISHHLMGVGRTNLFRLGLKLHLGLVLLIGAGLFVACEKDPVDEEIPVIPEVPVVFSSGLSDWTVSRAANGSWDKGDRLGIYMIPHTAEASAAADFSIYADTVSNVPYLTSGSGESVALAVVSGNNAIIFPANGSPVNFVAYSPYKAGTNTANGHVYKVDVSKQSPAKAIDLLYHKGIGTAYSKTNTNVTLGFTHQLSKMKISLVPASGTEADLTGAALTLTGFPVTANFNLSTGVLSNLGGADKFITPVKDAVSSADRAAFEAIVVPHTVTSYIQNVIFRINNTNYGYRFPASVAFKAGTVHSYNFKFTGTKVEPAQELVDFGDGGGMVSWGDYQLSVSKSTFNLAATRTTGNTVTLSTNAPAALTYTLSGEADRDTNVPEWMTGVTLSNPTPGEDGWNSYVLTFDTECHINSEATPRTGYIRLEVAGITLPVRVTQAANALYVREPVPASIENVVTAGATGKTFTIETNSTAIVPTSLTTTDESMITDLNAERSVKDAAGGIYLWTMTFDASANTTTSARSASISINIDGVTKTVSVSQVGMPVYVNEPSAASFPDLAVGGATGKTFTITTNAPDESITVNCPTWMTKQTPLRSEVAADGTSTWTIGFDVSANTMADARSGNIEVTIGGITKTVSVSQVAMPVYVNEPSAASIDVVAGGATGKTFTLETNSTAIIPTSLTTTDESIITNLEAERSVKDAAGGIYLWTVTFNVSVNTTISDRSASISINIDGITKTVSVSQVGMPVYVNEPSTASFPDLAVAGETGKTFTIETNAPDESITVNCPAWMTKQTPSRSEVAADGTSTWTIGFDVAANATTDARSGNIEVTIGSITKTVSVSQGGIPVYVNEPSAASIDVVAGGATGKTFTLETNSTAIVPTSLTTTDESMITNLNAERSVKDAAGGIYLWTVTFNVSANTTTSARSASISINIDGVTKTVSVSQVGVPVYVNAPNPASIENVIAAGETDKTFTITTNAPDESITVTTTNTSMITNLTPHSVAADGFSTWTISFDVTANTTTDARTGSIEVTIGGITKTVIVSQVGVPVAAPSNCYIVAPGAEIYIPVSRANEHDPSAIGATSALVAELVWTDTPNLLAEQSTYGSGSTGAIKVKAAAGKSGNAVVAVKVGGVIRWSWHIWVTNYDPQTNLWDPRSAGGTTTQNVRFMDRDLGAMEAANTQAGHGLHYQWGRKDPFLPHNDWNIIAINGTASVEESIQHPNTYYYKSQAHWLSQHDYNLWGGVTGTKTIYDPCPAGFRVPLGGAGAASPWAGLPASPGEGGYTWGTSFWPYGSYRFSNNTLAYELINSSLKSYGLAATHWTATANTTGLYYYMGFFQKGQFFPDDTESSSNGFLIRCVVESL